MRRRRVLLLVAVVLAGLVGWFVVEWRAAAPLTYAAVYERVPVPIPGPDEANRTLAGDHWEYTLEIWPTTNGGYVWMVERRPLTLMARLRDWWEGE